MAGNITDTSAVNVNSQSSDLAKAGLTSDLAYDRFEYTGNFTGFKNTPASGEAPAPTSTTPKAGLNWFIPTMIDGAKIKIYKHLYESDLVYMYGAVDPQSDPYSVIDKVYSEFPTDTSSKTAVSDFIINNNWNSSIKNMSQLPLITVVEATAGSIIYNFNEPFKLSPSMVPASIYQDGETRKKAGPVSQIIAFQGAETNYTYVFYGVDFLDLSDEPPEKARVKAVTGLTDDAAVKSVANSDQFWMGSSDNIYITNYDEMITDFPLTLDDGKTQAVGVKILKCVAGFFGLVVLSDKFEAVDPLLLTSGVGKPIVVQEQGSTTGTSTGITDIGTGPGTGGGTPCIDCFQEKKQYARTVITKFIVKGIIDKDVRVTEFRTTENSRWIQSAENLLNNLAALDEAINISKCIDTFLENTSGGQYIPAGYNSIKNLKSPYSLTELLQNICPILQIRADYNNFTKSFTFYPDNATARKEGSDKYAGLMARVEEATRVLYDTHRVQVVFEQTYTQQGILDTYKSKIKTCYPG